jgi:hypothetical protein
MVLDAIVRDRGFEARPSRPGRAAAALVNRLGGLDALSPLLSPRIIRLLYRLGERRGMTWFRSRLREALNTASAEAGTDAVERIESLMAAEREEPRDVTFDALKDDLRNDRQAAEAWLRWAEERGLLLRGASVECQVCGAVSWRAVGELAPPIVCRGCTETIGRPFPMDALVFRYRASEMLLDVIEADAIPHLLALRWFSEVFRSGFGPSSFLGGYPGVEIVDGNGGVLGEADVLLVFRDGSLAIGECKRTGAGLTTAELDKVDALASRLHAKWTFVATPGYAATCPDSWSLSQRPPPADLPRFALSGDKLFDDHPFWALGMNPFAWEALDPAQLEARERGFVMRLSDQVEWLLGERSLDDILLRRSAQAETSGPSESV